MSLHNSRSQMMTICYEIITTLTPCSSWEPRPSTNIRDQMGTPMDQGLRHSMACFGPNLFAQCVPAKIDLELDPRLPKVTDRTIDTKQVTQIANLNLLWSIVWAILIQNLDCHHPHRCLGAHKRMTSQPLTLNFPTTLNMIFRVTNSTYLAQN